MLKPSFASSPRAAANKASCQSPQHARQSRPASTKASKNGELSLSPPRDCSSESVVAPGPGLDASPILPAWPTMTPRLRASSQKPHSGRTPQQLREAPAAPALVILLAGEVFAEIVVVLHGHLVGRDGDVVERDASFSPALRQPTAVGPGGRHPPR